MRSLTPNAEASGRCARHARAGGSHEHLEQRAPNHAPLKSTIGGDAFAPGDEGYDEARRVWELTALVLMIEPITLGGGKTLFPNDGEARGFELISAKTANTGVQVCRYRPAR